MITEKFILDHMTNMGKSVKDMQSSFSSTEAVLTGLLANRDQMPEGMLDQTDKYLKDIRQGKADIKKELNKMQEIFKRNGNNGSK